MMSLFTSNQDVYNLSGVYVKTVENISRIPAEGQQSRPSRSLVRDMKFNNLNIVEGQKVL